MQTNELLIVILVVAALIILFMKSRFNLLSKDKR